MTYFTEIDLSSAVGGRISLVEAGSVGQRAGLLPGDDLLAINGNSLQDVIDVRYYGADENLELDIRRENALLKLNVSRDYGQQMGVEFTHPTFDTDIRRCNNLCEFCFVLQMAPRFRRTLYIKDDDYRYSFLFGHYVTLTNLSDHDWWRIKTMRLSPLYISVHVTDLERRRKFLRNANAPEIMDQLRRLASHGIKMHTQIVLVPGFNDGKWLKRSIDDLAELWPAVRSISIVPVGLTRHHKYDMRVHRKDEAAATIQILDSVQREFKQTLGVNLIYLTDEWYLQTSLPVPAASYYDDLQLQENGLGMVRSFLDEWDDLQKEIQKYRIEDKQAGSSFVAKSLTLVCGTLFAPTLIEVSNQFSQLANVDIEVIPVTNQRLGDTITVSGLLMAGDMLDVLNQRATGEMVILPRIAFDHPEGISLDDISPLNMAEQLKRPVALADSMGDVWDAVTGNSRLIFWP